MIGISPVSVSHYLVVGAVLFVVGAICMATKRNALGVLMGVENAAVHHLSGFAIGSATLASGPSPLSAYWTARNRTKFVKRWKPVALPVAIAYTLFKILQLLRRKHFASAKAAWRGLTGRTA